MSSEARAASDRLASDRYKLVRELGRGATGIVDLVYDEVRAAPVARKRMRQLTSETRYRIKQEFRHAQDVWHPNLVRLHDLFADEGDAFFTMEPVFGVDVATDVAGAIDRLGSASAEAVELIVDRLRQLAGAVAALHEAGIVHRDIKPSNVLVEESGRVVLLDFGFSSVLENDFAESEDRALVGTVPYMAPECLWGAQGSTRSDWYSVGAIAAELCLGRPLFAGSLQGVLRDKDRPPQTLRSAVAALPASIDELVCGWLRRDPQSRPADPDAIRAVLGTTDHRLSSMPRISGLASTFIGRSEELAELERAIPHEPRAQLVRLHGASGIGKTALARELTTRLSRRPGWIVFRGRCHPREHLALKALDSVMDEVSRYLKRAGARVCERVARLDGMDALASMFPVLGRVPELARLEAPRDGYDPQARWLEGLRAFRALWNELTTADRIAVWIDDLQWADKDGLKLLHELIAIEPRPKVTWLVSHRSAGPTKDDPAALLSQDAPDGSFDLSLSGLRAEEAAELSIRLGVSREVAGDVAKEADGSPFLVSELTRFAASSGRLVSVDSILDERLSALDHEERALVEQLALADEPLPLQVLSSLSGRESVAATLARLESAALVRASLLGDLGEVAELYHDRIREAVALRMQETTRRAVHLRLAEALGQVPGMSPASVAFHYRKAGERERGLALTLQAAEECATQLAFDQAAELYEEALALCADPKPSDLLERAGDALAHAGRCEDAAKRFLNSAERAENPGRKRRLRLEAGAQYLYAGRISEGRQVMATVMRDHGLGWPRMPLLASVWERGRVLISGTEIQSTAAAPADFAARFDVLWAVTKGTVMVEHGVGDVLALRSLREAMALGDPSRLLWSLGHEAASEANVGGRYLHRRAGALLSRVRSLAEQTGQPYDRAYARMIEGVVDYFQADFRRAEDTLRDALSLYRQRSTGGLYEQNVVATFLLAALTRQGKIAELPTVLSELRAVVQRTGNLHTRWLFRTASAELGPLAEDRPEDAIRDADAALEAWPVTQFTSQHEYHFEVTMAARLYAGHSTDAWQQVVRTWPQLSRAQFLRLDLIGILLRHLRARAALQAAALASGRELRELVAVVREDADAIGRSTLPGAAAVRSAIDYGTATLAGDWAVAARHSEDALHGFDRTGMLLARETARLRFGELCTDRGRGRAELERARAWFAANGVRNPEAMAQLMIPGEPRQP